MPMGKAASFTAVLLLASLPALPQQDHEGSRGRDRSGNVASQSSRDNRSYGNNGHEQQYRGNQNFYNGVREGGRGGQYDDSRRANDNQRYDQRRGGQYDDSRRASDDHRYDQRRGGIGAGKGAAIGGVGGAVLGAVLGGGLKGSLIGGAAGAGIGAGFGETAQHRRDERR
jgi:hypothetical protein